MTYQVFHRTWWKFNKKYPGGLEPEAGKKHILGYVGTEEEARAMCKEWNDEHKPGVLSDKAEYTSDY